MIVYIFIVGPKTITKKAILFMESARLSVWLCRAKLYTCARLAKNPQSVSPSKTVFRLHDRCFYAEMTVRRSAACSQLYGLA